MTPGRAAAGPSTGPASGKNIGLDVREHDSRRRARRRVTRQWCSEGRHFVESTEVLTNCPGRKAGAPCPGVLQ